MTRFLDTEDWQSDADENWQRANGAPAPLPSFLREEPLDRPEVTDLTLHLHAAGPSFRPAGRPAAAAPESTQEMALPVLALPPLPTLPPLEKPAPVAQAAAPAAPAAVAPAPAAAPNGQWTPALAYSSFIAAQPNSYEIAPDSYLAEAEPLPPSDTLSPEDLAAAEARGRDWDPLVDPWPAEGAVDGIEEALVEHAARERALTIVPDLVDDGQTALFESAPREPAAPESDPELDQERSPFQSVAYQPVVFSPAPFVPEVPEVPAAEAELEDTAMMTQPFDLSLQHPSGPLPRTGVWPPPPVVPATPAELTTPKVYADEIPASVYDVSLTGPLGTIDLGFAGGHWYSLAGDESRPVTTGEAMRSHPELVGQIVQVVSWWMRENPKTDRALDLATELAMAVSEVVRTERTHAVR